MGKMKMKKKVKNLKQGNDVQPSEEAKVDEKSESTDDSLLSNVLKLGGSKKDIALVEDAADTSDVEYLEIPDDDTEPIKRDDIIRFIEELGVKEHRPKFKELKEKKIKLVISEYAEKEEPTPAKEKKKSKNKFKVQDEEISSTTPPEPDVGSDADPQADPSDDVIVNQQQTEADLTSLLKYISNGYKKRNSCLIKPGKWLSQLENKDAPVNTGRPHASIADIEAFAKQVLDDDTETADDAKSGAEKSDIQWMKKMASSGTLADRAAALTTLVQQDALHNIYNLESMVGMVKKKDRRESMAAIDSLKDIFIQLLPNKRKLRTFKQMPVDTLQTVSGGNRDTQDRILSLWYFESHLKTVYQAFVDNVIAATFDTVSAHKSSALKVLLSLLMSKPEQEQRLLSGLVNKLGDPERKIAANVTHLLTMLVKKHPNMKQVVAGEVENILYRTNISKKAQYYAICFLNQMILTDRDEDLSVKLLTIYFSFFKASIKTNEIDSKLMSALLVGVVRAYPFAKGSDKLNLEEQIGAIYKLVHTVNQFNVSVQALSLLYQVCNASDSVSDRYYTSLYVKLLDPQLKTSSKQANFLHLLYKSMKSDPSDRRCKAFVKRLLQICVTQAPTFICAALMTVSELVKQRPGILTLKATVLAGDEDSDDEEHFVDAADSDSDEASDAESDNEVKVEPEEETQTETKNTTDTTKGWVYKTTDSKTERYDGLARNPLYCSADRGCMETELTTLSSHYHPSVVVFAENLLNSQPIVYSGDPMADFTLQKFLDRFVFKNPKKVGAKTDKVTKVLNKKTSRGSGKQDKVPSVNTEHFYNLDTENVPADQRFFHGYFHALNDASSHKLGSKLGKKSEGDQKEDEDAEDVEDDDFDSYLAKYEKSLYSDMTQEFGENFASDFSTKKKNKSKKGEDGESSDDDVSDDDDDDDILGDFELKPSDFGLDDDDLDSEVDDEEKKPSKKTTRKTKKSKQTDDGSSGEDSDDLPLEMDGEISDLDMDSDDLDMDSDDDMDGLFAPAPDQDNEIDEENIQFSDDEFGGMDFKAKSKKAARKPIKLSKKKKSGGGSDSIFAAADDFADLLDEESADKRDTTSSQAVVSGGKTGQRQLAWEDKQERWLSGRNRKRPNKSTSSQKRGSSNKKSAGQAKRRRK